MLPNQTLEDLDRPDWVLHLPPTPVNLLTVTIDAHRRDDGIDDKFTSLGPAWASLRRELEDPGALLDRRDHGLKRVDVSFAALPYPPDFESRLIQPLSEDRKVQLPKTWLKVVESGFASEGAFPDDRASGETRQIEQIFAQHPNAALEAKEQSLSRWLTTGTSTFHWNRSALRHSLTELNLTSCQLTANSVPTLVSYIEGNGSLRELKLTSNHLLVRKLRLSTGSAYADHILPFDPLWNSMSLDLQLSWQEAFGAPLLQNSVSPQTRSTMRLHLSTLS